MDTKLTLKLDQDVIERAKTYARARKISLSQLIENHLDFLTHEQEETAAITPLVKSLSGVVKLPGNYDVKESYKKHLSEKYSK